MTTQRFERRQLSRLRPSGDSLRIDTELRGDLGRGEDRVRFGRGHAVPPIRHTRITEPSSVIVLILKFDGDLYVERLPIKDSATADVLAVPPKPRKRDQGLPCRRVVDELA